MWLFTSAIIEFMPFTVIYAFATRQEMGMIATGNNVHTTCHC